MSRIYDPSVTGVHARANTLYQVRQDETRVGSLVRGFHARELIQSCVARLALSRSFHEKIDAAKTGLHTITMRCHVIRHHFLMPQADAPRRVTAAAHSHERRMTLQDWG